MLRKLLMSAGVLVIALICGFMPTTVEAEIEDIEAAILRQDYVLSKKLAEELLARDLAADSAHQAKYYLALAQMFSAEYVEARKNYYAVLRDATSVSLKDRAQVGVIDSMILEGQFETALMEAQNLLASRPDSDLLSLIYLKNARANLKLARWDAAQDFLKKIVREFPQSPEAAIASQLLEEKQYFAVQLGAFLDAQRAQKLVEELQSQKEYAYIVETIDSQGRKFFRVRVGQFSDLTQAQEKMSNLSHQGYPTLIYP